MKPTCLLFVSGMLLPACSYHSHPGSIIDDVTSSLVETQQELDKARSGLVLDSVLLRIPMNEKLAGFHVLPIFNLRPFVFIPQFGPRYEIVPSTEPNAIILELHYKNVMSHSSATLSNAEIESYGYYLDLKDESSFEVDRLIEVLRRSQDNRELERARADAEAQLQKMKEHIADYDRLLDALEQHFAPRSGEK